LKQKWKRNHQRKVIKKTPNDDSDKNNLEQQTEDLRYRVRSLAKIRANQQFYTELAVIQRVTKRAVFVKNMLVKGKDFVWKTTGKFFEPNVVISIVTAIYFYRKSHQLEIELTHQQSQIAVIERNLEQNPKGFAESFFKNNWPKIIISGCTVLYPVGKGIYNHWQTNQELVVAKAEVFETKSYLAETQDYLVETQVKLNQTQGELNQTQGDLNQTQKELTQTETQLTEATENISKVKINSQITLNEVKKETKIIIGKLHVTLRRFNDAAMLSAQQETKIRTEISECTTLLADSLLIRDDLQKTVEYYVNLTNEKSIELEETFLETKVLQATIEDKLISQARLKVDLDKAKTENKSAFFKIRKLKKQINNFDKERINLRGHLSEKNSQFNALSLQKQKMQLEYQVDQKKQAKNQKEIEDLKLQNNKNDILLQKYIDETNRYALKMDQAQNKIDQFKETSFDKEQKIRLSNQKIEKQNNLINELDHKNQQLEYSVADMKSRLNNSIIEIDELNCDIAEVKKAFNQASGQEKIELNNLIKEKQKTIAKYKDLNSRLRLDMVKEGQKLAQSYVSQDGLIKEAEELKQDLRVQDNKFFSRLQSERKRQDEKFDLATNTAAQLIDQILNKQDNDQDKSWWSKLSINQFIGSFQFRINGEPEPKPEKEIYKEHFFYSGPGNDQTLTQRVVEKFNHKTGKFEMVKDKLEVIK